MEDDEFGEFVRARWLTLVRGAVLLGAGREEAEDLAQATLLRCYRHWSKVTAAEHVDAYVSAILLNVFRQSRRRRWWRERPTAAIPDAGEPDLTSEVDRADAVRRSLDRLGPDQREAVVLRYFLHLDEARMAQTLGVAPGTVKSRLSRALRVLAADAELAALEGGIHD